MRLLGQPPLRFGNQFDYVALVMGNGQKHPKGQGWRRISVPDEYDGTVADLLGALREEGYILWQRVVSLRKQRRALDQS